MPEGNEIRIFTLEPQRQALIQQAFDLRVAGCTYKEIGEKFGVPVESAFDLVQVALRHIGNLGRGPFQQHLP